MERSSADKQERDAFLPVFLENYARIQEDMVNACAACGRSMEEITLLGVTKTVSPEHINVALDNGIRQIGENRVQEYLGKREELHLQGVGVHLIGHLQTNKVDRIVGEVDMIQSVESLKLAEAIDKASQKKQCVTDVLVEVNIGNEESKSGISAEMCENLLYRVSALQNIHVRGLMTIPPISDTEREKRAYFSHMQKLFIDIKGKNIDNVTMDILSMGMSSDYVQAILEGSTMVRIGSALFGKRIY